MYYQVVTINALQEKHGQVRPEHLPVRQGPKFGARVFSEDAEEKIFLFVKEQGHTPEYAAVTCRTTKTTIYAAINRVLARYPDLKKETPASTKGHGADHSERNDGDRLPVSDALRGNGD